MPFHYSHHSIVALALFGILAAIMASLSVILIFQVQSASRQGDLSSGLGPVAARILLPASAVLGALCLAVNASCLLLCLLHSYFTAEVCREDPDSRRCEWFLLDNRSIRQSAICLFCLGISLYLTALSLYMLILFEIETGIASSCILCMGSIFMIVTVAHMFNKATQASCHHNEHVASTLYENDSAHEADLNDSTPSSDLNNDKDLTPVRPRPEIHREFSYPQFLQQQQHKIQLISPIFNNTPNMVKQSENMCNSNRDERYNIPRMQRTLSVESGLMQPNTKPWNGGTQEMRTMVLRKPGVVGKDSTLV
ncbi:PREDICTED: transmembrane protein 221 [Nanorana parkeri]|uniref:transmembrane protein 221 n=1 Tax=Nanorana parkeri TaxID=125878 RepID=UPI0008544349|nr:PREDICTED: transmembrane protein 221 [Nanorana parkeri]